ncbi:MAG: hypothetical protein EPO11_07655 [Gammaproteobacteria bacterium]|nr:MAG: hypothetical protein EPO11_07655 [Gammaproteobacteria bacterium]
MQRTKSMVTEYERKNSLSNPSTPPRTIEDIRNQLIKIYQKKGVNIANALKIKQDGSEQYFVSHLYVTAENASLGLQSLYDLLEQKQVQCEPVYINSNFNSSVLRGIVITSSIDKTFEALNEKLQPSKNFVAAKNVMQNLFMNQNKQQTPSFSEECLLAIDNCKKMRKHDTVILNELNNAIKTSSGKIAAYQYMSLAPIYPEKLEHYLRMAYVHDKDATIEFIKACEENKVLDKSLMDQMKEFIQQRQESTPKP